MSATTKEERTEAQKAVAQAIREGLLVRPEVCSRCGKPPRTDRSRIHGHHPDYSKPLEVCLALSIVSHEGAPKTPYKSVSTRCARIQPWVNTMMDATEQRVAVGLRLERLRAERGYYSADTVVKLNAVLDSSLDYIFEGKGTP